MGRFRRSRASAGRGSAKLIATLVAAGVVAGGLVSVAQVAAPPRIAQTLGADTKPAAAATPVGTAWQLATNSLVLAAFSIPGVPGLFYCASATAAAPLSNAQQDLGELDLAELRATNPVAMRADLTPDIIAGVNRIQHLYGQDSAKPVQVAAVSGATHWLLQGGEISSREFGGNTDLRAAVAWAVKRDPELKNSNVADLAVQYYNEAMSYVAGKAVSAGSVVVSGAVDGADNYNATVTVTPSVTGGTASFDLVNARFADGSTHFSGALSGATTFNVRGVPPAGQAKYRIGVSGGHYSVTGDAGYAATLHAYATAGEQMIVVGGAQASGSASTEFAWTSPAESSAVFQPTFTSQIERKVYQPGDAPRDHFTVSLATMAGGLINEWPRSGSGSYLPLPVTATMYLLKAPLTPSAAVPADARAIATGKAVVGGGTTDPTKDGGFDITFSKLTGSQVELSGHVTVVLTVDSSSLSANTAALLPAGWAASYATEFGDPNESAVIPPEVVTRASTTTGLTVNVNGAEVVATGRGLPIYESYTVNGYVDEAAGLFVVPRHYTAEGTVDSEGTLQDGALQCTPETLDATGEPIPVTRPGDYEKVWQITPGVNGLGTFTEQFVDSSGAPVGPESDCQDVAEWTAQQELLVHTVAAQNGDGLVRDTAYVYGTVPPGAQLIANLHQQEGAHAAESDPVVCTTAPVGIPHGLANALTVTTPWTDCGSFDGQRYFRELAVDVEGNVIEHGRPGAPSEYVPGVARPSSAETPTATPTPSVKPAPTRTATPTPGRAGVGAKPGAPGSRALPVKPLPVVAG